MNSKKKTPTQRRRRVGKPKASAINPRPAKATPRDPGELYRSLVEASPDMIFIIGRDDRLEYINRIAAESLGHKPEDLIGKPRAQFFPSGPSQRQEQRISDVFESGKPLFIENYTPFKGRDLWLHTWLVPLKNESGEVTSVLGIARDITERKKIEESLRDSEERFRNAFDNANIGMCLVGLETSLMQVNPQMAEMFGYTQGEMEGRNVNDFTYPEDRGVSPDFVRRATSGETDNAQFIKRYYHKKGHILWGQVSSSLVRDTTGKPLYFISHIQDITGLKQAEEGLHDSEEKYRTLVERAADGILIIQDGVIQYANPRLGKSSGYEVGEIQGKRFTQFIHPTEVPNVIDRYRRRLAGEEVPAIYETTLLRKDGSKLPAEINAGVISYQGKPADLIVVRDLTERRQAEESLREQERFLASVFASIQDGISILDPELRILSVNPTMEQWFVHALPLVGKKCYAAYYGLTEPCEFCPTRRTLETGKPAYEVVPRRGKEGEVVGWLDLYSFPRMNPVTKEFEGVIEYARDITERKWAEEKVLESELQHRTTLDFMGDAIHVVGRDLRLVLLNERFRQWCRELGLETEVIGRTVFEAFPFLPQTVREEYEQVFRTGETLVTEETSQVGEREIITETRKIPILQGGEVAQVVTVVHDITKRKRAEEELSQSLQKIQRTLWETIEAMALIVERRDPYTAGHQRRVTLLAQAIAEEMGLSEENIQVLRMAGLIHDIGKISVPSEILSKPTPLSDIEFSIIKSHVQVGFDILKTIAFPWPVAPIMAQHHERMDGSGYPKGLTGKEIFIEARILAVADVIEAMSSYRPYRPAPGLDKAFEEITRNRGILYDPQVVDACLKLFSEKGFSFEPKEEKG